MITQKETNINKIGAQVFANSLFLADFMQIRSFED